MPSTNNISALHLQTWAFIGVRLRNMMVHNPSCLSSNDESELRGRMLPKCAKMLATTHFRRISEAKWCLKKTTANVRYESIDDSCGASDQRKLKLCQERRNTIHHPVLFSVDARRIFSSYHDDNAVSVVLSLFILLDTSSLFKNCTAQCMVSATLVFRP